ncbi:hypothetical protein JOD43_000824 [Pullulanibacillus pueri]|uniref:Uncharacterized protein n=1 Tax=Pullulanibacillus pueri TaxID=1437324 RepID=A0A8J2ZX37_9BACL|nr:hypothetical protein [Pullulanibacillus pueri]MBM7680662.1 hypothetical protein [Pullulanibacillus pueri]GGH83806.1 hypothetical protein GCM10007096_25420 [Pullulanibacillus pueri]
MYPNYQTQRPSEEGYPFMTEGTGMQPGTYHDGYGGHQGQWGYDPQHGGMTQGTSYGDGSMGYGHQGYEHDGYGWGHQGYEHDGQDWGHQDWEHGYHDPEQGQFHDGWGGHPGGGMPMHPGYHYPQPGPGYHFPPHGGHPGGMPPSGSYPGGHPGWPMPFGGPF